MTSNIITNRVIKIYREDITKIEKRKGTAAAINTYLKKIGLTESFICAPFGDGYLARVDEALMFKGIYKSKYAPAGIAGTVGGVLAKTEKQAEMKFLSLLLYPEIIVCERGNIRSCDLLSARISYSHPTDFLESKTIKVEMLNRRDEVKPVPTEEPRRHIRASKHMNTVMTAG